MIELLKEHFTPDGSRGPKLAIEEGKDGARLSHDHTRQYNYVLQSLALWREIIGDMFRLWYLADEVRRRAPPSRSVEGPRANPRTNPPAPLRPDARSFAPPSRTCSRRRTATC